MDKATGALLGKFLIVGLSLAAPIVILWSPSERRKRLDGPVIAAVTAYVFYVAAALIAGAKMPEFLREHLFDGFAPAAVVGLLVSIILREDPMAAFPRIRRRVTGLFVMYAAGALVLA